MKNILFLSCLVLGILISFSACKKEVSTVNEKGLTREIVDLVPAEILAEMEDLGMPIYGGDQPPNIENSFIASPLVLLNSNVPADPAPGHLFDDYYITFSDQKNDELSVMVNYVNGPEEGEGLGSFIVGSDDLFSVFFELSINVGDDEATAVGVVSGKLTPDGIENFYNATFLVDILSDEAGYFIEEGQGRVSYDEDGFSEKI